MLEVLKNFMTGSYTMRTFQFQLSTQWVYVPVCPKEFWYNIGFSFKVSLNKAMFQLQVFVMLKSTEHDLKMPEHYRFCFVCKKSIKNKKGLVSTCCEKSISMCKFIE